MTPRNPLVVRGICALLVGLGAASAVFAADGGLSLSAKLSSRYETVPATYRLQAQAPGLTSQERKNSLFTVTVDGRPVIENASSMLTRLTIGEPGTHVIGVSQRLPNGEVLHDEATVSPGPNQPPLCNIKVTLPPDLKSARPNKLSGIVLNPDCRDPDGRIKSTSWYMNGSTTPMRQSSTLVVPVWNENRTALNCFTVRFVARDDYGNTADGQYTFGCGTAAPQ